MRNGNNLKIKPVFVVETNNLFYDNFQPLTCLTHSILNFFFSRNYLHLNSFDFCFGTICEQNVFFHCFENDEACICRNEGKSHSDPIKGLFKQGVIETWFIFAQIEVFLSLQKRSGLSHLAADYTRFN